MKVSPKTMLSMRGAAGAILVASVATGASHASDALPCGAMTQASAKKEESSKVKAEEQKEEKKEEEKEKKKVPCPACGLG